MTKPSGRCDKCVYFRLYQSPFGGWLYKHNYTTGHDRIDNIRTGRILADKGYCIHLLPDLDFYETDLRLQLLPDVFGVKNPDARINERWIADFKKPDNNFPVRKSTISRFIESAAKQKAEIVVINLSGRDYSVQDIKKGIIGSLQPERNKSIRQVWIITKKKGLFLIERKNIFEDARYLELYEI